MATLLVYPEAPLIMQPDGIVLLAAMMRMLTLYVDRSLWRQLFVITGWRSSIGCSRRFRSKS